MKHDNKGIKAWESSSKHKELSRLSSKDYHHSLLAVCESTGRAAAGQQTDVLLNGAGPGLHLKLFFIYRDKYSNEDNVVYLTWPNLTFS